MNMHITPSKDLAKESTVVPIATATPDGHTISPRDRRFGRGSAQGRWWFNNDPLATAWFNALSLTFPRGEAFFIESVKAFRDQTPAKLQAEIRAFIQQEVIHSREHLALNRRVEEAGYDTSRIDRRITESLALTKDRPQIANLAATMILEHFTAIMAKDFLTDVRQWDGADPEIAELWRWHALEEIEHKGVAYDTWLYATRDWSRWKRWKVKAMMMLLITHNFFRNRYNDTLDLLAQDGFTGWRTKARVMWFMAGSPGILRKIAMPWIKFFLPGFHPWNEDDRGLIRKNDSPYQAAMGA